MRVIRNGILDYLQGVAGRAKLPQGWLNRVGYPMVINFQIARWQTEGASEGVLWKRLNERYRISKLERFKDYPGAGKKMLVATNRLYPSMTGREESYKLVTNSRIEAGSFVPYGNDVNQERDITTLGDESVQKVVDGLLKYLMGA